MNSLVDSHETEQDMRSHGDRELTLGTTTILGIFFALAVLCAVFFGFGYSLGSRHSGFTPSTDPAPVTSAAFNGFKPAPGSPVPVASSKVPQSQTIVVPYTTPPVNAKPSPETSAETIEVPPHPIVRPPLPPVTEAAAPSPLPPAQTMVQIAAVSHQEDAELIANTLTRRGYTVGIHNEPQDKLLHVQIGPFAARKDAEAMRLRLQADGFNAYIK